MNPAGGVWFGTHAVFDFDIEVEQQRNGNGVVTETRIKKCNCGFYGFVGDKGLPVAVRYEADFLNIGNNWAEHPTHHLQWDPHGRDEMQWEPHDREHVIGATKTRLRVNEMLPTHFFEFCTRHYFSAVWEKVFDTPADELITLAWDVKERTTTMADEQRLQHVDGRREEAHRWSTELEQSCHLDVDYFWWDEEPIQLPL